MIECEAGRHAELIAKEVKVEDAKPLISPMIRTDVEDNEEENKLSDECSTASRSIAARATYFAFGRPDVQSVCKEISAAMTNPCERH